MFAHIAGVPVEETLLSFAPVGAASLGMLGIVIRRWTRRITARWKNLPAEPQQAPRDTADPA
jgi:hypothetical protein